MDSTKAAYEPVSTEEEPVVAENAADTAPIVETTPIDDTPPEVAEKNEKNAEKSAEADKVDAAAAEEEKKEEETAAEQNGNVSLDLDSSIVPLKEVSFDEVFFFRVWVIHKRVYFDLNHEMKCGFCMAFSMSQIAP